MGMGKDAVEYFVSLRTHLAMMCKELVCDGEAPRLKALGRRSVGDNMLWKIKQALPCEEEMASYSEMPKRECKAKKPYMWYFRVYDYVSYVFIEAAFEFSSTPSLQCTINVKYRVIPEKVTGMKPAKKYYFRLLVCGGYMYRTGKKSLFLLREG